jgi:DNA-binding transcriptional MerR regulator
LYERHGLVRPLRTSAGWRVYGPDEITRLHQVLMLKGLGLPLARIGELIKGRLASLDALLALQEDVLVLRKQQAEQALAAVRSARRRLACGGTLSLDDLANLTRETTMTETIGDEHWPEAFKPLWQKHMSAQELDELQARKMGAFESFGGDQEAVATAWYDLIRDCNAEMSKGDPGSPAAVALVRRWKVLQDAFTGGDPALTAKTGAIWQEALSDPAMAPQLPMTKALWDFMAEAGRRLKASEAA